MCQEVYDEVFAVIGHGENNGFIIQQHLDFSHYFFMLASLPTIVQDRDFY